MKNPTLVTSLENPIDAEIACGRLKSEGITCATKLNPRAGALAFLGESTKITDIFVEEKDVQKAKEILDVKL